MRYEERCERVETLAGLLGRKKEELAMIASAELQFAIKDCRKEVAITVERLGMFRDASPLLSYREPPSGPDSKVALMLSYNGSAWLNTAITSIYMVGNRVSVKFASRGSKVREFTESIYRPLFGDRVTFYQGGGKSFIEESLKDPDVHTVVIFGFDGNILPYEETFKRSGKKMVFEGPGQDPFIVFPDADMDLVLRDLMAAKFMYSGQTCTAPKRIFIHRDVYDEFLERFVEKVSRLNVGDPIREETDVSPVASALAVERIKKQLRDAVSKGARVLFGGEIEGSLIHPTVVKDATDEMLGMREEVFGPVAFTSSFGCLEEVLSRSKDHKYGLRAALFGGQDATKGAEALKGGHYCHPVTGYTFGKFGTVACNQTRAESWRGAFVTRPVGGYGYSGWIWETGEGEFRMKQGPKLLSVETSTGPLITPDLVETVQSRTSR